jgi:MFS family permease
MPQRYVIVAVTALAALWLYIDRVCFSTLATPMKAELLLPRAPEPGPEDTLTDEEVEEARRKKQEGHPELAGRAELTPEELVAAKKKKWADERMSFALGAFFFTYALFQIPMGSLADRYGARRVLALSIAAWSLVTMATGFVPGFFALIGIRLLLGISESSAYPAAAGLIKNWAKPTERGLCSSIVAFGGRAGGAIAPWLTAALAAALAGVVLTDWLVSAPPAPPGPDGRPPANWRGVFVVYGACGLLVALLFWLVVRDRPAAAEKAAPQPGAAPARERTFLQRLGLLAQSRNMWSFGALQFGVNLGWAFIITLLPTYLKEAFNTPLKDVGPMQSTALTIGVVGMLCGGVFTDWMRARLGPKRGRSVPIAASLAGCAAAFLVIPVLPTAWSVIFALGAMAFLVDMHNPSIWSFAQDVGGKNVGAALGWGTMWGNLGAAVSPVLLTQIRLFAGWNTAFLCCGAAFAAAAVCGLMLDATRHIEEPTSPSA